MPFQSWSTRKHLLCHRSLQLTSLLRRWLSLEPLSFCIVHAQPRLLNVDAERANALTPTVDKICAEAGIAAVLVLHPKRIPRGMENYHTAIDKHDGSYKDIFKDNPTISPEDNAVIMFTSGEYATWSSMHDLFLTATCRYGWIAKGCIEHPASVPYEYTQRIVSYLSSLSSSHSMYRQSSEDGEHCSDEEEVFQNR